jgi:hypothetical protein
VREIRWNQLVGAPGLSSISRDSISTEFFAEGDDRVEDDEAEGYASNRIETFIGTGGRVNVIRSPIRSLFTSSRSRFTVLIVGGSGPHVRVLGCWWALIGCRGKSL